ncbi:MAG TPA: tyrosine-type recombinase/integrase, partial [Lacipirellulaceae bacterium]|nr:tyrosine-type recombinase/integrase [Lacipirellulaceae bacterium]
PLCPPALALLSAQPRLGRWVFTAPPTAQFPVRDRQIDERRALYHLHRILKPLGLNGKLHSFRHSLISYALSSGTPEATVRKWAGHVDGQILKVYTHIADCESKAQMARLFPMSESASSDQPVEGQGTEGGDSQPKE